MIKRALTLLILAAALLSLCTACAPGGAFAGAAARASGTPLPTAVPTPEPTLAPPPEAEAVEQLAREGFDPAYGARPLRRLLRDQVEDPIAEGILAGTMAAGDRVRLSVAESTLVIAVEKE